MNTLSSRPTASLTMKSTTYTLSLPEIAMAREIGASRYKTARDMGVFNARQSDNHSDSEVDEQGARGEIAFAGMLLQEGLVSESEYLDLMTDIMDNSLRAASTGEDRGDLCVRGQRIDVKASDWGHISHLWLRPNKLKAHRIDGYALVFTVEKNSPTYTFAGYMSAADVAKRWNEPRELWNGEPGKFPQRDGGFLSDYTAPEADWSEICFEALNNPNNPLWNSYMDLMDDYKNEHHTTRSVSVQHYWRQRDEYERLEQSMWYFGCASRDYASVETMYEMVEDQRWEHLMQVAREERYSDVIHLEEAEREKQLKIAAHFIFDLKKPIPEGTLEDPGAAAMFRPSEEALKVVKDTLDADYVDEDALFEAMREQGFNTSR